MTRSLVTSKKQNSALNTACSVARSDKSVACLTNNKRVYSTFCTVEANYWQTRSIARPLCDSKATCLIQPYGCHITINQFVSCINWKTCATERVENDAPARPPNLTSASCDLELWPPDSESLMFHPLSPCTTFGNLQPNRCMRFRNIVFTSLITDELNERTGREHNDSASQSGPPWRSHIYLSLDDHIHTLYVLYNFL